MKQTLCTFYELAPEELAAFAQKSTSDAVIAKSAAPQINISSCTPVIERSDNADLKNNQTFRSFEIGAADNCSPTISELSARAKAMQEDAIRYYQSRAADSRPTMSELSEMVKAVQKEVDGLSFGQSMPTVQPTQKETHYDIKAFRRCRFGAVIFLIIQMVIAGLLIFLHNGLNESGTAYKAIFFVLWLLYCLSPSLYQLCVPGSLEKARLQNLEFVNDMCIYTGLIIAALVLLICSLILAQAMNGRVLLLASAFVIVCMGFFQTIKILIAINEQVKFHK